jgi:ABC-type multidrug transport system fused ATPase/permease subunit
VWPLRRAGRVDDAARSPTSLAEALQTVVRFADWPRRQTCALSVSALMAGAWSASMPLVVAEVYTSLAGHRRISTADLAGWLLLGVLASVSVRYRDRHAAELAGETGRMLRNRLVWTQLNAIGEYDSMELTAVSGVEGVTWMLGRVLPDLATTLYRLLAGTAVAFLLDWRVGIVVVASIVPTVWLCGRLARRARTVRATYAASVKRMAAEARRFWHPAGRELTATLLAALPIVARRGRAVTHDLAEAEKATFRVNYWPATQILGTLLGISLVGVSYLLHGVPVGVRVAVTMLATQHVAAMLSLVIWLQDMASQIPHIEAVAQALDVPTERCGGARLAPFSGRLEIRDVHASYPDGRRALSGLSLEVAPGEAVALAGPSGAGKTTVTLLAVGSEDLTVESGEMLLDGVPISRLDLLHVRGGVVRVPQRSLIPDGTVLETMLAPHGVPEEQIRWACKLVLMDDEIMRWPDRYQTRIDGDRRRISGGQAQRLALARALLHARYTYARLMLLDEPTEALDPATSDEVLDRVLSWLKSTGTAALVVTHRLPVHPALDRVVVIRDGRDVENGDPRQLASDPASAYSQLLARDTHPSRAGCAE